MVVLLNISSTFTLFTRVSSVVNIKSNMYLVRVSSLYFTEENDRRNEARRKWF